MIIIFFFALLICATACKNSEGDEKDAAIEVNGMVQDINGDPLENVAVSAGGESCVSGSDGSFSMTLDRSAENILSFSIDGYAGTGKTVKSGAADPSSIKVTMIEEAEPVELDATLGGTATGARSASLTAGLNAFADSEGSIVSGTVNVHLTPLDPLDAGEAAAYPGNLAAVDKNGGSAILQAYGIMDVRVKQDGKKLRIADGSSVSIGIPGPAGFTEVNQPDDMQMWYFDMIAGRWMENENAGAYDSATNTYSADVAHLSWRNCDKPFMPACIYGKVVDSYGDGVPASITAQGYGEDSSPMGVYASLDANDGNFCMTVEAEEGSFMGGCDFDSDCDEGYSCCGALTEDRMCLPDAMCYLYENSCKANIDCLSYGHDYVYCSYGFFKQRMIFDYCE